MSERRSRVRKFTSSYFLVYDRDSGILLGRILDLTPEGAMMISDEPVDMSAEYQCRMVMPIMVGMRRELNFDAEVRWTRENNKWEWFETGFKFKDLTDADRDLIEELIGAWVIKEQPQNLKINVSNFTY